MPTLSAPLSMTSCLTTSLLERVGAAGDHDDALHVLDGAAGAGRAVVGIRGLVDGPGPAGEVGDGHEVVAAVVVPLAGGREVAAAPDQVVLAVVRRRVGAGWPNELGLDRGDVGERPAGGVVALVLDRRETTLGAQVVAGGQRRARGPGLGGRADLDLHRARHAAEAERDHRVVQRLDEGGAERPQLRLRRRPGRSRRLRQRAQRDEDGDGERQDGAAGGGHELPFAGGPSSVRCIGNGRRALNPSLAGPGSHPRAR